MIMEYFEYSKDVSNELPHQEKKDYKFTNIVLPILMKDDRFLPDIQRELQVLVLKSYILVYLTWESEVHVFKRSEE